MSRRLPAWLAVLFIVPAAVLPGGTAAAQVCAPPSAEHAFEELLDLATDDSPVEDEAWRIAGEQESRGAFESPETIRRIDELARANGFAYDCSTRLYRPVSGPDPRDAIENDDAPAETGTGAPDGGTVPGAAPDTGAPGSSGEATVADGSTPPAPGQGGEVAADGAPAPEGAAREAGRPGGTEQGSPATAGGRPAVAADAVDDIAADDILPPESGSQGGVVALPGAERTTPGRWRLAGIVALLGGTAVLAVAARAKRRRPEPLN
ncbi:MAG TPA: hypothetical protein VFS16_06885 [Acidimicrobiia bacterium]|nr:hypothetical protein [Acidimicrobiia bacterium]